MTNPLWRPTLVVVGVLLAASVCGGCAGSTTGAVTQSSELEVQVSQLFVTVANRGGRALLDVRVDLHPVGGATVFTTTYPRMDPGQKSNFSLGSLRGRDGTPLNLRVVKPKMVVVTAKDSDGKTYETQVPWP